MSLDRTQISETAVLEPPVGKRAKIKHFWIGVGPRYNQPPPPGTPALCGYKPPAEWTAKPSSYVVDGNRCVVCIEIATELGAL